MKGLNYFKKIKLLFKFIISIDKGILGNKKMKNSESNPTFSKIICFLSLFSCFFLFLFKSSIPHIFNEKGKFNLMKK